MNEPDMKVTDGSELADLKEQCSSLRRQMTMILMAMVVFSFTFMGYVFVQSRRVSKELDNILPEAQKVTAAAAKEDPVIKTFMARLTEYSKTHPDFAPIMARYRVQGTSSVPITATETNK